MHSEYCSLLRTCLTKRLILPTSESVVFGHRYNLMKYHYVPTHTHYKSVIGVSAACLSCYNQRVLFSLQMSQTDVFRLDRYGVMFRNIERI